MAAASNLQDFPTDPELGQVFIFTRGWTYQWDGYKWTLLRQGRGLCPITEFFLRREFSMRNLMYILDAEGKPIETDSLEQWKRCMESEERTVARDTVGDVHVSTVFLGVDHNFGLYGPPILWETMVFNGALDGTQERYSSREAALAGHRRWLCQVTDAHVA